MLNSETLTSSTSKTVDSLPIPDRLLQLESYISEGNGNKEELRKELLTLELELKKNVKYDYKCKKWLEQVLHLKKRLETIDKSQFLLQSIHSNEGRNVESNKNISKALTMEIKELHSSKNHTNVRNIDLKEKLSPSNSLLQLQPIPIDKLEYIEHSDISLENEGELKLYQDMNTLSQVNTLLKEEIQVQEEKMKLLQKNTEKAVSDVESGTLDQKKVLAGATIGLMVGGAVVGGAVGGPVGAYLGYQMSALGISAGVGLGVSAGFLGGGISGLGFGKVRNYVSGGSTKLRREKMNDQLAAALDK